MSNWRLVARPEQISPSGDWDFWILTGGRGSGKTRALVEAVHEAAAVPNQRLMLAGRTKNDVRSTLIEGESGILNTTTDFIEWTPSKRQMKWPNGTILHTFAEEDGTLQLRGPQFHRAFCDDVEFWDEEFLSMARLDTRLGIAPRVMATATPEKGSLTVEYALEQAYKHPRSVRTTRLSTYDNRDNLNPRFIAALEDSYQGTSSENSQIYGIFG